MNKKEEIKSLIINQGLLPLYYNDSGEMSMEILRALYKAGIRIIEYTNRGIRALDNFLYMKNLVQTEMDDMKIGIGTIKTETDAEIFIAAGADFIVCPVIDTSIAKTADKSGLLWIPGTLTPSEINTAEKCGASLVKIFPGNLLGPSYIAAVKEIFPNLQFIPTGGVDLNEENIRSYFNAGVVALGMGSKLITKSILESKDFSGLTQTCIRALGLVEKIRK
jgi:2-dehydro-3-deoxyphosphogluconate aldolase / (4S)-4-hydroxy-2-oxoglutarate aldolase